VLLVLEAWKETVALRMLGRCYRMCFLLFTEKRLVELETDVLRETVPRYSMPYAQLPSGATDPINLLWHFMLNVMTDVAVEEAGIRERKREREEVTKALSGEDVEEVLTFLRGYLASRMKVRELREGLVAHHAEVDRIEVRRSGSVLRIVVEKGKRRLRYELSFSGEEAARLLSERLSALGLPNLEVR